MSNNAQEDNTPEDSMPEDNTQNENISSEQNNVGIPEDNARTPGTIVDDKIFGKDSQWHTVKAPATEIMKNEKFEKKLKTSSNLVFLGGIVLALLMWLMVFSNMIIDYMKGCPTPENSDCTDFGMGLIIAFFALFPTLIAGAFFGFVLRFGWKTFRQDRFYNNTQHSKGSSVLLYSGAVMLLYVIFGTILNFGLINILFSAKWTIVIGLIFTILGAIVYWKHVDRKNFISYIPLIVGAVALLLVVVFLIRYGSPDYWNSLMQSENAFIRNIFVP